MINKNFLKSTFLTCAIFAGAFYTEASLAMSDSELQVKMRQSAAYSLITVKTPKLFFHWVDASDITPRGLYNQVFDSNNPQFIDYVNKQATKVYRQRSQSDRDVAGPGLYLASDPKISRRYGGSTTYGLIVGMLRPNARVIVRTNANDFPQDVLQEINARNCHYVSSPIDLIESSEATCTKLKQLLLGQDLSLADGRLYPFGSSAPYGCTKVPTSSSFNTYGVSTQIIDNYETLVAYSSNLFSEIYGFTHKSTFSPSSQMGNAILSYLKGLQSLQTGIVDKLISDEQMRDPAIKAMSASEIKAFTAKYILGCN